MVRMKLFAAVVAAFSLAPSAEAQAGSSSGTGVFIGPSGRILTSSHVVEGADDLTVVTSSGERLRAVVEKGSQATDLAVLKVDHRPRHYLEIAPPGSVSSGDRVFTFGFPVTSLLGLEPKFSEGAVSALSGVRGEAAFMQITVPLQPGNSGGPIVTESGQLVGVVAAVAAVKPFLEATGTLPQNVNWGVRSEYALPLLPAPRALPLTTRQAAIARTRDSVVLIVARAATGAQVASRPNPSSDAAEDAYLAGYRAWEERRFAQAALILEAVALNHPSHRRASYARNLRGRAYLDDNKPASAAKVFLANYQIDPMGERAPDSLLYLGEALVMLRKPAEACKVYKELQEVHRTVMRAEVRNSLPIALRAANCN